jgi:heme-degrading monooxygenase HmoA
MIATIWRFHVVPSEVAAFERAYGPAGDWAKLFARAQGYAGTELLRFSGGEPVYLTIDRWNSEEAFHAAKRMLHDAYAELDRRCDAYTCEETWLGMHTVLE